jgi:hypothetical protein
MPFQTPLLRRYKNSNKTSTLAPKEQDFATKDLNYL